ncbi:MAG: hypothetical protein RLZZ165_2044 [Bacteroidota bacterium]|jgi:uncharacterized protein (DUF1684 family)
MSSSELPEQTYSGGINSRRNSTFIVAGVGTLLLIALLFQWVLNEDTYLQDEEQFRTQRDENFRSSPDSPIPDSLKARFTRLDWYPIRREFRVDATFEGNPKFERIEMPRSQGKPEWYIVAGWLHFKIKEVECKLTAYQSNPKDSKTLFVPFRDLTTGKGSYGGGRYMDTRRAGNRVPLDFNRAYNPYCVYNYAYACPLPPQENHLPVAIEAGEKDFHWN